ncbi:MAG TPA: tail fiber domain-containing protein [Bacteroidales bacterium]|nr:tail fiber domain-containing protein [Bacteroidales bacterium]
MKKLILLVNILFFVVINNHAQFKIISNGEVRLWTNNMGPYDNSMITYTNNDYSKAYIVSRNGTQTFMVHGRGRCYSTGFITMSDSTSKINIKPIDNALNRLMHLNGVTYSFKNEIDEGISCDTCIKRLSSDKMLMGLIAQNVMNYAPEAVDSYEDGKLGVQYGALVGLLIESIKEQQNEIEQLQKVVLLQEDKLVKNKLEDRFNNIQ